MIPNNRKNCNLTNEIKFALDELSVFDALRKANIYKRNGVEARTIFLTVFNLVFSHMSWSQLTKSKYQNDIPKKDSVYRFLSNSKFNWRTFLFCVAYRAVSLVRPLTNERKTKVFIIDDTPISRSRSKKTELLSVIFDHVSKTCYRGFHYLTLGWSDGKTFIPVDFSPVSSVKKLINDIKSSDDKRTISYRRKSEAKKKKTDLAVEMVERALKNGIYADYVLMDTWFASPSMFQNMRSIGIDAICMLKKTSKHLYTYKGKQLDVNMLFDRAVKTYSPDKKAKGIISSIVVNITPKLRLKLVYVVNRNNRSEWIVLGTTDISLSEEEIIAIYSQRWQIEVFFKSVKSTFHLEKEFMIQSFDGIVAHTSIVFTRYIVTSWILRKENDPKTLGGLFLEMYDDFVTSSYMSALCQLIEMIEAFAMEKEEEIQQEINKLFEEWLKSLPEWMQDLLNLSRNASKAKIA